MADIINLVDDDDGYANKKRSLKRHQSAQIKNEQQFDCANDERSLRRLRRHSALSKYDGNVNDEKSRKRRTCNSAENRYECSLPNHREEEERDENYAAYLGFFAGEDKGSGFQNVDDNISSDTDVQFTKFLSCLKPYKNSYVLNLVKADGTSKLLTYEDDDMTSDQLRHNTSRNATGAQEEKGEMLHHISENMLDNRNGKGLKSTNETSKTVSRLGTKHRMGMENARYSSHGDSLIADPEITPLEPVGTESHMGSIDDSYKFFLMHEKKIMYSQDSKKCSIRSEAGNATKEKLIKRTLGSNVFSGNMFDGKQGKRPRLSQDSGNGAHKTMDANVTQKALAGHKSGTTGNARQKVDNRQGGTNRHSRDLENGVKRTIVGEVMGLRASNDKQGKRCGLSDDSKTVGRSSRAPKVTQEATGATVHLAETPDNKQGKKRRLSGDSKKATKKASADNVTEEAAGLHTSHGKQSSGMKSRPKNHHQPGSGFKGSQLKFGGNVVDDSYKALLSGLREHKGQLIFQSVDGKVVIYEKDWNKECSTDSYSDSDSVIIIDKKDFNKPRKSSFKDMELAKSQTRNDSSFRNDLMNILSKPYDQDEYESLMEEASKRRPLERHGELRWGRKRICELELVGKSHLDHYKDVAEAIENSRDDRRKLILLRGFMFWLENIAREGVIKPWIDEKCWEALRMSKPSKRHKN
ncbi:unnamed protein product [Rhodiola kirilowii]